MKMKIFSMTRYVEEALKKAKYTQDENGVVIAKVPWVSGFFSQGDTFEEARENLKDAIEGNILLLLQLGKEIPPMKGVRIKETQFIKKLRRKMPRRKPHPKV
jgi:predicted RNase H-like HicB family nuclease